MRIYTTLIVLATLAVVPAVAESFGHGLGGDVAPALDLDGRDVTVSAQLTPADLSTEENEEASMAVRFYDVDTDEPFSRVTYRIEIWQGDDLIARNLFFDEDGTLDVELRTKPGCSESALWRCTKYFGSEHPIAPGALYAQGQNDIVIQGPIFDRGGLYNIKVGITAATSPRTSLASPLNYDTFISVADVQPFTIRTAHAEVSASIKTYYDEVSNIQYDSARESVSFEMPFDWDPDYVDLVPIVHEEIHVPKSFDAYSPDREYAGYVDGVRLDKRVLISDPYTYEDRNVIHFLVTTDELRRINSELGPAHEQSKIMSFELVPEENVQKNAVDFYLVSPEDRTQRSGATVEVSWEAGVSSGSIPLEIAFFDESGGLLRDARYDYILVDHATDKEIFSSIEGGTLKNAATEGIDIVTFDSPGAGTYRLDLALYGQGTEGLDFDDAYAGIGSGLVEFGATPPEVLPEPADSKLIPSWIKRTVGWWADGIVSDVEFVSALEFLIEQGVIDVSAQREAGAVGESIPSWIKRTAGWWADGIVSDVEFVSGLEFLIQKGIIRVGEGGS